MLKDVEKTIGRDQLTSLNLGNFQSDLSVATLGLIAIAQCLSPSHAALTYSLYTDYKDWREENRLNVKGFKGFQSNRFGGTTLLASLYLEHREHLIEYFESNIGENNNRLVLALYNYFKCEWFTIGCCVMQHLRKLSLNHLQNYLELTKTRMSSSLESKLPAIKIISIRENTTNLDKLVFSCAAKVIECLERQIERMPFFEMKWTMIPRRKW